MKRLPTCKPLILNQTPTKNYRIVAGAQEAEGTKALLIYRPAWMIVLYQL